ncbi:sigma 54-interacting transcriptional regulator [Klebsiella variicola subsp. variicola]|nr:sigma 54-interacting transcriptional regulator [Klebsiella variicola subsp. variicola]
MFSFLTKPVDKDALYKAIDEALEQRSPATDEAWRQSIVTRSPLMLRLLEQAGMVAQSDVSVLINGQSGTGRRSSPRRSITPARVMINRSWRSTAARCRNSCSNPNCLAMRGRAFTGAVSNREGLFQAAEGGTLFLDEIGDMPGCAGR